jgi:hypothetical protein
MTDVRGQMSEEFEWGRRKSDERSQPSRRPEKFTRLGRAAGLIEKETLKFAVRPGRISYKAILGWCSFI